VKFFKKNTSIIIVIFSGFLSACGGSNSINSSPPTAVTAPSVVQTPVIERPQTPSAAPDGPDFHPLEKRWSLSWSDEFDGDLIDREKWSLEHACWGGGNNEKQCYTVKT